MNSFGLSVVFAVLFFLFTACSQTPTSHLTPVEFANYLGYETLVPMDVIESDNDYSYSVINTKAVVFDFGVDNEYLLTLERSCKELNVISGLVATTGRGGQLKQTDSITVEDKDSLVHYCRIDNIYRLVGKRIED